MKKIGFKILVWALRILSKRVLRKFRPRIVAVTGSVGKSSAKEAIYLVLKTRRRVWRAAGNLNTDLGMPLAILGFASVPKGIGWLWTVVKATFRAFSLRAYPEILVLEMAADKPGDIGYLISIAKPQIAVITQIGHSHLEFFGSVDSVAQEKAKILQPLSSQDFAILNADDWYGRKFASIARGQVVTFGLENAADFQAKEIKSRFEKGKTKTTFLLLHDGREYPASIASYGQAGVYSALIALAVGRVFSVDLNKAIRALGSFQPLAQRTEIWRRDQIIVIDDTYNANPESMKAALKILKNIPCLIPGVKCRRIAILGDMLELGKASLQSHHEIGKLASQTADWVIGVGPQSRNLKARNWFERSEEVIVFLFPPEKNVSPQAKGIERINYSEIMNQTGELSQHKKTKIAPGDIILVKGSHAMGMGEITKAIKDYLGNQ